MKGDRYERSLLRHASEIREEKRQRYWQWNSGLFRGLRGVNTYMRWSLKYLMFFLFLAILTVLAVLKCESWIMSALAPYL